MTMIVLPFILVFFFFVIRSSNEGSKKYIQGKYLKRLLVSYLIILLVSPVLFYFLQTDEVQIEDSRSANEVMEIHDHFYDSIYANEEGELSFDGMELREEFSYDYTDRTLNIVSTENEISSHIIIEKQPELNEEIRGSIYILPSILDGIEFTDIVPSLDVDLNGGTLTVEYLEGFSALYTYMFEKEFTIAQFTENNRASNGDTDSALGDSFLYLQISEDVTVVSDGENIQITYVKE